MTRAMSMPEIIGYMSSQLFIAKTELKCHLEAYDEPNKDKLMLVVGRLEKAIAESEEMWENRD